MARTRLTDPTKAFVDEEPVVSEQPQEQPQNTTQGYKVNGYTVPNYQYGSWSYSNPYVRGGFSYKDAPEYINRYQEQIDDLANRIQHYQGFSYNYNTDPLYQQYAEAYNRNGQNAMRNTLAQMAARTGGMASSYAGNAAQNAYNEYMQGLNDKVPELYQLAYGMYNDKLNKQRNDLSMLEALEQGDYAKYVDLLNQYNTDRNVAYNVWNATEGSKEDADRLKAQYDYNVWKAQQDNAYDVWSMQQNAAYNTWKAQNDADYALWKYQQDEAASDKAYEQNLALQRLKNEQELAMQELKNQQNKGTESTSNDEQMTNMFAQMAASGVPKDQIYAEVVEAARQGYLSPQVAEDLKKKYSPTLLEQVGNGLEDIGAQALNWLNGLGDRTTSKSESTTSSAPKTTYAPDDYEQLVESEMNGTFSGKLNNLNKNDPASYETLMRLIQQNPDQDIQKIINTYLDSYGW